MESEALNGTDCNMTWLESIPPLAIITLALGAMGSLQAAVHRGFNGGKVRVREANGGERSWLPF